MSIPGLSPEACRRRNRNAALRSLHGAPVRLFRSEGTAPPFKAEIAEELASRAVGQLPRSEAHALEMINALRPGDAAPLTSEDVYLHYAEAANDNFIPDRYMFLSESTLKNVARDASKGTAFMNSHRTGGMSTPTELPFGKTFAGRYETAVGDDGKARKRAMVGFYMLRGVQPNGSSGPSTDDLHRMIESGTLFDCSVGLYGGTETCDVCGKDVMGWDEEEESYGCDHAPGTTLAMTKVEKAAQRDKGVPEGRASYSLEDAGMGEVSAVFDGAVPGAGFRKALSLASRMNRAELAECRSSYHALARLSDFHSPAPSVSSVVASITPNGASGLAAVTVPLVSDPDGLEAADYRAADGSEQNCNQCEYLLNDACQKFGISVDGSWVCDSFEASDSDEDDLKKKPKRDDVPRDDGDEPDDDADDEAAPPGAAFSMPAGVDPVGIDFLSLIGGDAWTRGVPLSDHTNAVASTCEVLAKRLASRTHARAQQSRGLSEEHRTAMEDAASRMTAAASAITECLSEHAAPSTPDPSLAVREALQAARVQGSIERARYESLLAGVTHDE